MLSRYNPVDIEAALRSAAPQPVFPPCGDRAAWSGVKSALGEARVHEIVAEAETYARTPVPDLPATLYLEYVRTGQREGYQNPRTRRRTMLASLVLAECLENQGRFLDPILNGVWAICEESSWVLPAHQSVLTNMKRQVIDLGSAMTSLALAEVDALVGAQLDPLVGERIRYEVENRSFTPYMTRHDFWWLYNTLGRQVNNWTAVCNAGVVGAAIYLEKDFSRLAEMIARAARSMDDYLATFDADGGSSEGPGYWSYGFGYYTILGQLVEQRTAGKIAFMGEEIVRKAAQFPLRTVLSKGVYVNFSDCDRNIMFNRAHLSYLAQRLDLPDLTRLAREQPRDKRMGEITWGLRDLFWQPAPETTGAFVPARQDWFPQLAWMLARYDPADPKALTLAAKGGHNNEMHNQNDVGNLIVHVNEESLIADIGRGRYTKAYFGPERYQHFVNSSSGHSVPRPNGKEQLPGEEYAAVTLAHVTDTSQDSLSMELKGAYPAEADLESLKRTVTLHRTAPRGWVELVDEVKFASKPGQCESVLTTFSAVTVGKDALTIQGKQGALKVSFDPAVVAARVDLMKQVDLGLGPADVNCIVFAFHQPVKSGMIHLRIDPA
jgi:hypothetical protein